MTILAGTKKPSGRAVAWTLAGASCLALGAFALAYPLNHDVGWYLHIARAMLDGRTLYTSIIEVNPPLYAYLSMLPVELAGILGASSVRLMQVLLLIIALAAVGWAGSLARQSSSAATRDWGEKRDAISRFRGPLVAVALAVPVLGLAGVDFAQREHLMVVLTAPYLVLAARRRWGPAPGRAAALVAGVLAGVGFSLKPHFVVLWLAIELALLARRRSLRSLVRAEALTVVGFFLAYAGFVVAVHPEYLVLLWHAAPLYADYLSVDRLGLFTNRYSVLLAVTVGGFLLSRPSRAVRPFVVVFLLAAGLAFLVAIGQGKGWLYHFFPALAWTVAAGVLLLAEWFPRVFDESGAIVRRRVLAIVVLLTTGVLAAGSLVVHHQALARARGEYVAELTGYFDRHEIRSIVILSPALPAAFPLVNYTGVDWVGPFPSLWWVDAAHADDAPVDAVDDEATLEPPAPGDSVEAAFLESMAVGIARNPPDRILVDTTRIARLGDRPFPYGEYLAQDPAFAAVWRGYEQGGTLGPFALYSRGELGDTASDERAAAEDRRR